MKLVFISPTARGTNDFNNPSEALRNRPLCGLEIGSNFKPQDNKRATDGTLYDPKTGKTYRGVMTLDGADLKLRGYISTPLFGRTEVWHRAAGTAMCSTGPAHPHVDHVGK